MGHPVFYLATVREGHSHKGCVGWGEEGIYWEGGRGPQWGFRPGAEKQGHWHRRWGSSGGVRFLRTQ